MVTIPEWATGTEIASIPRGRVFVRLAQLRKDTGACAHEVTGLVTVNDIRPGKKLYFFQPTEALYMPPDQIDGSYNFETNTAVELVLESAPHHYLIFTRTSVYRLLGSPCAQDEGTVV